MITGREKSFLWIAPAFDLVYGAGFTGGVVGDSTVIVLLQYWVHAVDFFGRLVRGPVAFVSRQ